MNLWQVLSQAEIDGIHQATIRVLGEVGIVLKHAAMQTQLLEIGCMLKNGRVLLPAEVVEKAIAGCGKTVIIEGRNGQTVTLGDGTLHWHNLGGARDIFDPLTGQPRAAVIQDVKDSTRLLDALDQADTITPFFTPQDVPGSLMSLAMYRHALPFTTKPVQGPGVHTAQEVNFIVRMAEVIGQKDKILTLSASPVSPLTFPDNLVDSMIEIARHGIPFGPLPCPTAGTTAPFSLAGALTQQNAEVLASIVISQLIHPGLPIIYCGRLAMMEPRTGNSVWGGVELGIVSAATVQIGHHYQLPVNVYGFTTNAHTLDLQNGYERALNALMPALAGADELSGIGEMDAGVMGSYAQMVCDNQIAAGISRVKRGFKVNEDSLAVDVINEVMNDSHTFIAERHSINYLRSGEILFSKLSEKRSFSEWDQTGRRGFVDNAQANSERLLANHMVPPLEETQEKELDKIMYAATKALVNQLPTD
jgi:trimethylamine--corrinoid protein Co-methyltransferase